MSLKIAGIVETALGSPERAFEVLREALTSEPQGQTLLPEMERLAAAAGEWAELLEVYAQVARSRPDPADKVPPAAQRAAVHEQHQQDASAALEEHLRALTLASRTTRGCAPEIGRLAEATGRWEDAIAVEAQRFARATDFDSKVVIACRAAALVEDKLQGPAAGLPGLPERLSPGPREPGHRGPPVADRRPAGAGPGRRGRGRGRAARGARSRRWRSSRSWPTVPPSAAARARRSGSPASLSAWAEFAQAYELLPAAETAVRHRYLRRAADVWERGAKDIDRALDALERAFRFDTRKERCAASCAGSPASRTAGTRVRHLRAGGRGSPREEAVALHHDVARFHEALDQHERAEQSYQSILLLKPDDGAAMTRLEELFRRQERWDDLASLLEKRTTGALQPLPARQHPPQAHAGAGRPLRPPPGAPLRGHRHLRAVRGQRRRGRAGRRPPRGGAGGLRRRWRRWPGCMPGWACGPRRSTPWSGKSSSAPSAGGLRALRWRIGEMKERELGLPDEAISAYEAILETAPARRRGAGRPGPPAGRPGPLRAAAGDSPPARRAGPRGRRRSSSSAGGPASWRSGWATPTPRPPACGPWGRRRCATRRPRRRCCATWDGPGWRTRRCACWTSGSSYLVKDGAPVDKVAALQLEAAALRLDRLDDVDGARRSIEAALALHPDNPGALGALARLHLRRNDFAAYARARAREAEARRSGPEAAEAWLEAGPGPARSARQARPTRGAASSGPRMADPTNASALRGLAALLTAEGQLGEARAALEKQLELMEEPTAKAVVLTDLARSLWEKPGDAEAAIARLDEALELAPDYLPAVVTMADVYYREQQWAEAERRLLQAVRRMKGQPGGDGPALPSPRRGLREAGPPRRGLPAPAGGRADDARPAAHPPGHGRKPLPGEEVAGGDRLPAGAGRPRRRPQVPARGGRGALARRGGRGAAQAARARRACCTRRPCAWCPITAPRCRRWPSWPSSGASRSRPRSTCGGWPKARATGPSGPGCSSSWATCCRRAATPRGACGPTRTRWRCSIRPARATFPCSTRPWRCSAAAGAAKAAAATTQRLLTLLQDPKERAARRREAAVLLEAHGEHGQAGELLEQALAENAQGRGGPGQRGVGLRAGQAPQRARAGAVLDACPTWSRWPTTPGRAAAAPGCGRSWASCAASSHDSKSAIEAVENAVAIERDRVSARVLLAGLYGDKSEYAEAALVNRRKLVASRRHPRPSRCARWPGPTPARGASIGPAASSRCSSCSA